MGDHKANNIRLSGILPTLRMMMGCFAGFCSSRFLKYGEQAHKIILWAFVCWPWTPIVESFYAGHVLQYLLVEYMYLSCDGHITEALLIPEVFEWGDHVGLEIVPAKAELLVVSHREEQTLDGSAIRTNFLKGNSYSDNHNRNFTPVQNLDMLKGHSTAIMHLWRKSQA